MLGLVVACSSSNNRQQERIDMILNMFPNYDTTPMRQTSQELQSQNICFGIGVGNLNSQMEERQLTSTRDAEKDYMKRCSRYMTDIVSVYHVASSILCLSRRLYWK